ncbi:hypothetical protein E2C01_049416 [Portunus trituberculatus]|uniref:Uncharacterized protein n=1 Tax=Portunus trituberculatus TaxID=210409 RepID=A0A5B7GED0_PORTR|nr:hypothetical protein [Portunus trituberculatus]
MSPAPTASPQPPLLAPPVSQLPSPPAVPPLPPATEPTAHTPSPPVIPSGVITRFGRPLSLDPPVCGVGRVL